MWVAETAGNGETRIKTWQTFGFMKKYFFTFGIRQKFIKGTQNWKKKNIEQTIKCQMGIYVLKELWIFHPHEHVFSQKRKI